MLILGIETSCDETGVALYDTTDGLLADVLFSQVDIHAKYGGVVPELASRDHIKKLIPLCREALIKADKNLPDLDGVAYTAGPGLMGALLVGASFARSLAWALDIPALGVHHMEAHLLAPLIVGPLDKAGEDKSAKNASEENIRPPLPFIALLVSGGHTQLVEVQGIGDYRLLGESLDDAAGEAFDKAAKMLDLGYPGGPLLARCAKTGDPSRFRFPRPMTDRPGLDFSFSGLKTFTLNTVRDLSPLSDTDRADVARAFEDAVIDTLTIKCRRAIEETGVHHLVIAGGVSANRRLREKLADELPATTYYAKPELCTDNGAMIAYTGCIRLEAGHREPLAIVARARWPMTELSPL